MELISKPGYKQTEVGLIPDDWAILKIGDALDFKNGLNKESQFFGYGTPIINYMDVFRFSGIYAKDVHGKVFLSSQEKKNFSAKKGDVFFTRTSETQEEIGISAVLLNDITDCVFSGFVLRGRPKNNRIIPEYFQYCLTPNYVRTQIISTSSYTTRALTNGRYLSNIRIYFPPTITEQKAIATALSDTDELIFSLEKLIAKKKNIKHGAMQQLLTPPDKGGNRLKGFSGNWSEASLGELLLESPKYGINAPATEFNMNLPTYLRITDFDENGFVDEQNLKSVSHVDSKKYILDLGDIVLARTGASVGKAYLHKNDKIKFVYAGFLIRIKPNQSKISSDYLFQFLQTKTYWNWVQIMSMRSGQPGINGNEYSSLPLELPNIEEQQAIAQILSDIDLEIEMLEAKKEKYQNIKQGMMQELLTGKTRLV